ncbi:unnamed protein product, partial [Phaeothamnion confervicola]
DGDYGLVAKGFRNPMGLTLAPDGSVYVGDVGFGTAETIKHVVNPSGGGDGGQMANFGWPCMEGNDWADPETLAWLHDNKNSICDPVRGTADGSPVLIDYGALYEAAIGGGGTVGGGGHGGLTVDWTPSSFQYRSGPIDPQYPDVCDSDVASITALRFYTGTALPERYQGRLFVGDHAKDCVFYFD